MEKVPSWVGPLLKFGSTALIAFYLVYTNNKLMSDVITRMSVTLIEHELTTNSMSITLKDMEANADKANDSYLRLLRVICRNTATDVMQRNNCDNN